MSAQPSSSSMERGASTSPLRPISFGDPVVNIERRDDGTIYLRPKQPLGDYPVRLTDRLHHWANDDAGPRLHGRARRRPRLAQDHLRRAAHRQPAHCLRA